MTRIMITGAHGMVGRNLVERLESDQGFDLLIPGHGELDLLDRQAVAKFIENYRPDVIFHLAARVGGIQANISAPVDFLADNLLMNTHVILEAMNAGVKRLINLGSSCMYPRDRDILRETDILTGELEPTNEGYALAKISAARLCQYITHSKGLMYKTIIPCNLYGRHDHFDTERSHMVPAVIRKLHEAKETGATEVNIWGDGESRREFMYVDDLIDFLVLAITQIENLPDMINVGPGIDYSVNEYYQIGAGIVGYEGGFIHDLSKPAGMRRKLMDVSGAYSFGWKAKTSLKEGMRKTYDYYRSMV